jgi:hypothetical protein
MKRENLRLLGLAITLALVVSIGLISYSDSRASSSTVNRPGNPSPLGIAPIQVGGLGKSSTLDQVKAQLGLSFNAPENLPVGARLSQVRISADTAYLIYDDPALPKLQDYDTGQLIISIVRDDTSYARALVDIQQAGVYVMEMTNSLDGTVTTITRTATGAGLDHLRQVTVSGHPALGIDPFEYAAGHADGLLQWWSGGVHYTIIADLPVTNLVQAAESMGT